MSFFAKLKRRKKLVIDGLFKNSVASRIAARGIMGMNRRNISYISRYNSRRLFPLVDNKLLTKKLALENDVTVPDLIAVVSSQHDISSVMDVLLTLSGCLLYTSPSPRD